MQRCLPSRVQLLQGMSFCGRQCRLTERSSLARLASASIPFPEPQVHNRIPPSNFGNAPAVKAAVGAPEHWNRGARGASGCFLEFHDWECTILGGNRMTCKSVPNPKPRLQPRCSGVGE